MQSRAPNEVMGIIDAKNVIKFEYCGGWGYRKIVVQTIAKIEETYPSKFHFTLYRDTGTTNRFEVTAYIGSKSD